MTRGEALQQLYSLAEDQSDVEITHTLADKVLCDLLKALGYEDVVAAWEELEKWYA